MRLIAALLALATLSIEARAADDVVFFQNLSPISAVSIIAKEKKFFDQQGLNVDVRNVTSGKLALDALVGGSANLATVSEVPLMRAALAGQNLSLVATMEKSDNDVQVLARADLGIKSLKDLKGKRIATAIGTSAEYMLLKSLESAGLKFSDATVVNLRPQDMAAALSRGDVEAYAIWQPHVYNGEKLVGDKSVRITAKGVYVETFNIAGMQDYVRKNPEIVRRFLKALIAAEVFIQANKDESIKIASEALKMDVPTLTAIWSDFNYQVSLDEDILLLMKQQAEWDISSGKPATVPDVNKALRSIISTSDLAAIDASRIVGFK